MKQFKNKFNLIQDCFAINTEVLAPFYTRQKFSIVTKDDICVSDLIETDPRHTVLNRKEFIDYADAISSANSGIFLIFPDMYQFLLLEIYDIKTFHIEMEERTRILIDKIRQKNKNPIIVSPMIKNYEPEIRKYYMNYMNNVGDLFNAYSVSLTKYEKTEIAALSNTIHQVMVKNAKPTMITEWILSSVEDQTEQAIKTIDSVSNGNSIWFCSVDSKEKSPEDFLVKLNEYATQSSV